MQENARETRRRRQQAAVGLDELSLDLSEHLGIQMALELFLRMDLAGTISASRSARMIRYIRALQANVPHLIEDGMSVPELYRQKRREALRSALPLADRSAIIEHDERVNRVADRRETHQAILETNDKFARTHPKPDANCRPSRPLSREIVTNPFANDFGYTRLPSLKTMLKDYQQS